MKTLWNERVASWHISLQKLKLHTSNFKKIKNPKRRPPRPVVRRPLPLSTSNLVPKSCVPRLVTQFEPEKIYTDEERIQILCLLNTMLNSRDDSVTPRTSDDTPVILDSGCSIAICIDEHDFPNGYTAAPPNNGIQGIGANLPIKGHGLIRWRFQDIQGNHVDVDVNGYYVPDCPVNLLPPQQLIKAEGMDPSNCTIINDKNCRVLYQGHIIEFPYDERCGLPILKQTCGSSKYVAACLGLDTLLEPYMAPEKFKQNNPDLRLNTNLTGARKKLLEIHRRSGHIDMSLIQHWANKSWYGLPTAIGKCTIPICADCQFGGANRKPHNRTSDTPVEPNLPGEFVATDQMNSPIGGLIPFHTGSQSKRRYTCSTIFVDRVSRHIYCCHQETAKADETVQSKREFERFALSHDVHIRHYRCDNGIYHSKLFKQDIVRNQQSQSFSGIGAHWQNGLAERYIGTITRKARIMLLHAMARWPSVINETFWSFAFKLAVHQHNHLPRRQTDHTPFEAFTMQDDDIHPGSYHIFGCPAYILDPALADGKPHGKWKPRSYIGVYVGVSNLHASNVAMIYNPATGLTSPAYHCFFDEEFTTVSNADPNIDRATQIQSLADQIASTHHWQHIDLYSGYDPSVVNRLYPDLSLLSMAATNRADIKRRHKQAKASLTRSQQKLASLKRELSAMTNIDLPTDPPSTYEGASEQRPVKRYKRHDNKALSVDINPMSAIAHDTANMVPDSNSPEEQPRSADDERQSSSQTHTHLAATTAIDLLALLGLKLPEGVILERTTAPNPSDTAFLSHIADTLKAPDRPSSPTSPLDEILENECLDSIYFAAQECCPFDDTVNFDSWAACRAAAPTPDNPDVLTQSEMLRAEDKELFVKDQLEEISGLQENGVFAYQKRTSLPEGASVLNSIWSYRRKRRPDGTLYKHKSRICADGSMQEQGRDFTESYAPVVQWSSVRLCLILATMLGLPTRQIDFTQAFTNANIDEDVFISIPQGWFFDETLNKLVQHADPRYKDLLFCMQLVKNLYGTKQAARNWYLLLSETLTSEHHGFKASAIDPCLFIRKDCIILVYTDDCIILGRDQEIIDQLKETLHKVDGFIHRDEGTLGDFLGVHLAMNDCVDGTRELTMTQPGLIDSILTDVGLSPTASSDGSTIRSQPSTKSIPCNTILRTEPKAEPFSADWNYRSIIGKLNFLAQNTRPDIAFAVHQCARFVCQPMKPHQDAVKYICRYLLGTRDKGMILHPDQQHRLTAYVDADFAGTWHRDYAHLRESALSRTGFIICYANCPILWTSKLQTEIALSTCEAEYIALSMCVRSLIPLRTQLNEVSKFEPPVSHPTLTRSGPDAKGFILCKQHQSVVYEDNTGALEIANQASQYRPRTKHISIKWHRFRDHVRSGEITVNKISTLLQWADFLTKPLSRIPFCRMRKMVMGW